MVISRLRLLGSLQVLVQLFVFWGISPAFAIDLLDPPDPNFYEAALGYRSVGSSHGILLSSRLGVDQWLNPALAFDLTLRFGQPPGKEGRVQNLVHLLTLERMKAELVPGVNWDGSRVWWGATGEYAFRLLSPLQVFTQPQFLRSFSIAGSAPLNRINLRFGTMVEFEKGSEFFLLAEFLLKNPVEKEGFGYAIGFNYGLSPRLEMQIEGSLVREEVRGQALFVWNQLAFSARQ